MALGLAGTAWGQATSGTIYGSVPLGANETVQVTSTSGYSQTFNAGASGKYSVTLPVGTYTVSLLRDGKVVESRSGVSPAAAGAVAVNFSADAGPENVQDLGGINVSANAMPPIDVKTTNQVTTVTAADLLRLPLARSAEDIAMLAPGVNMGSPELGKGPLGTPLLTFGAGSTAENAYYIDGVNVTDSLYSNGGVALPYGAIEQQQTFTSGYGAKYGRSIGGVINQIGKSGTNEWHFGARTVWKPGAMRGTADNHYFVNPLSTKVGQMAGDLAYYNKLDTVSEAVYDVYLSGPLIKDKLFFFASAEEDNRWGKSVGGFGSQYQTNYRYEAPKYYAKLNWNINENNYLTLTGVQSSYKQYQSRYEFDYDTFQRGNFDSLRQVSKKKFQVWAANYTSYLTDNLTLNAMVGKTLGSYETFQPPYPGIDLTLPYIDEPKMQNPAYAPPSGISNTQGDSTQDIPTHKLNSLNYRVSLDYQLSDHQLSVGIDNRTTTDIDDGYTTTGPGYYWGYGMGTVGKPIIGDNSDSFPYVAAPDTNMPGNKYYAYKSVDIKNANVKVVQRALYIEDNWQITPNFLLSAGLRDDMFTNYNSDNEPYIRLTKPQWAPRLGFSWDVHGDSSLKVFGNAGRYYLAIPLNVAVTVSSPVTRYDIFGTYTGIDQATGEPIGFTPLPQNPSYGVSINNEYGQSKDPRITTAQNIKAQFSDNYVLGMQQAFNMLGTEWVFGATGTYQRMDRVIDDYGDTQRMCAAGRAQGYDWMTPATCDQWAQGLLMINPGVTQKIWMNGPDGNIHPVTFTREDQGLDVGPVRRFYSIDLSLGHDWDSKWMAKFDYVFSKTWGNTEGPVSTYSQQSGSYLTTAWDFPERMEYSMGELPNSRRHQFKAYGAYALSKEWTAGGNVYVTSGTPRLCRGYYGPGESRPHGSSTFYWCGGKPAQQGSLGRTPWVYNLDLNLDYKPEWAGRKLDFNLAIFNVLNRKTPLFYNDVFSGTTNPNPDYGKVQDTRSVREVRLMMSYDF
ncbi:TonB-dependent receptor [Rhodanobacter soli]|uniref:Outer membrane receptor for ferrienterochelin and colicin n=1 Tax=Rhodanobacter soli TaxID=590609 RepID=A0ABV2PZZ0_9GAMM